MSPSRFAVPGVLAGIAFSSSTLAAQRSESARWLEHCGSGSGGRFCEVRELGFDPSGPIRVEISQVGGVQVQAWDEDSVHVEARVQAQAGSSEAARALVNAIQVEATPQGVRAFAARPQAGAVVTLVMLVPRRSDLTLQVSNGGVSVDGVTGRMALETFNGPLTLTRVAGDVRGRTHGGPVHVTLAGSRWEGEGLNAETLGGPATLALPRGYAARLETGTLSGPAMQISYPLSVAGRATSYIRTDIGGGGAGVRVVTRTGPASLQLAPGAQ